MRYTQNSFRCISLSILLLHILTNICNRSTILHVQQSAEAGSRLDILHQLTILSSVMTHQPSLMSLLAKKRKMTSTKKTAQKTHGSSSQVLTITSAPDGNAPTDATPPHSEGNKWLLFPLLTIMHPVLITLFSLLRHSYRRYKRGKHPRNCFSTSPIVQVFYSSIHHFPVFI